MIANENHNETEEKTFTQTRKTSTTYEIFWRTSAKKAFLRGKLFLLSFFFIAAAEETKKNQASFLVTTFFQVTAKERERERERNSFFANYKAARCKRGVSPKNSLEKKSDHRENMTEPRIPRRTATHAKC